MEFIEPPPLTQKRSSKKWEDIVEILKSQPNEWARKQDQAIGTSTHIKNGRYPAFYPPELPKEQRQEYIATHWEITTRSTGSKNRVDLFMRWIGE